MRQYYVRNKAKAVFINTEPSLTDQSQAKETDINIIVKRYATTGTAPGATRQPMYADLTSLPEDLRDAIEQSRQVEKMRKALPPQLREMPVEQLLSLTDEQINDILKPATPAPTPAPPEAPTT